ncbi:retrovirus-related pol polyprotein from transposon TNT 1-94 [Tanacetum coccineum]|uniref:Retrovirus-related pol polyprotein from transposon TNT 1-94 n=1 Tax=Tanacetum coccineum TaxID=301880 RepID=A0ABQ4Z8A0_9ASTR
MKPFNPNKATSSQAWLWHRRLSHLNFDTINLLSKYDISFDITATDAPNQHQQQNITPYTSTTVTAYIPPLNIQTTPETTNQAPTQAPTVTAIENINQAKIDKENAQVEEDEFINIFSTPVQEQGETSSRYVNSTRRQLETDGKMCMFALTMSAEPKNVKEAMANSAWIEAMQKIHTKGYGQQEGIDFEESFEPVARLEVV